MAENVTSGAKALWSSAKSHWGWALVAVLGVVIVALWYDHKNNGDLTKRVAGLPGVGKLFA